MSLRTFTHIGSGRDLMVEEQGQFYNSFKSCIWLLKIAVGSNTNVAAGVCINKIGHILTSSSAIGETDSTVFAREINSSDFQLLKIIKRDNTLMLLEVTNRKKEGYDYAEVSDDSLQITKCQEIYCILHEISGIYSFAVGEVSQRKQVIDGIPHFQVANVHTIGRSDIIFSSTGHIIGIVVQKLSLGEIKETSGHNLVLHFSEINKFLKACGSHGSSSKKHGLMGYKRRIRQMIEN